MTLLDQDWRREPVKAILMATASLPPVIDADGHVLEDLRAIGKLMPEAFGPELRHNGGRLFNEPDNVHLTGSVRPPGAFDPSVDADAWLRFAEDLNLSAAVLYPSHGLASGRLRNLGWARAVTRAYNDWLAATYLAKSPRLRGMALVPLQDPAAAVVELRRAVTELGMCGVMFPTTGLNGYLGDRHYRPIYEAANELGCVVAVHGGSYAGLGLEQMNTLAGAHALGHPFGIMVHFTSMIHNRIFDDFPNVRFAFLEAGAAWVPFLLERLDGSYRSFLPIDPDGDLLKLRDGESISDRVLSHLRSGRIFVGVEGDEPALSYCVQTVGPQPFVFSSDFPHEVNLEICRHEIEELCENAALSQSDKAAILHGNAARLYGLNGA
jgi:predicted TIM-barrel fold metal-dependent hydrolase